jgi:hypothetical protein
MQSGSDPDSLRSALRKELVFLRGHEGLNVGKIKRRCPQLREIGRRVSSREDRYSDEVAETVAFRLIQQGLRMLAGPEGVGQRDSDALTAAFAIPDAYSKLGTLNERRVEFAGSYDGQQPDTVTEWEETAVNALTDWLVRRGSEVHSITDAPTNDSETPSDFEIVRHDFTLVITESQQLGEMFVVRDAVATCEGASRLAVRTQFYDDQRSDIITLQALANCRVLDARSLSGLEQETDLALPRTKVGATVRFSYRVTVASHVPMRPIMKIISHAQASSSVIRVQFADGNVPSKTWAFWSATELTMPADGEPQNAKWLNLNDVNYVEFPGPEQKYGESCGIRWQW